MEARRTKKETGFCLTLACCVLAPSFRLTRRHGRDNQPQQYLRKEGVTHTWKGTHAHNLSGLDVFVWIGVWYDGKYPITVDTKPGDYITIFHWGYADFYIQIAIMILPSHSTFAKISHGNQASVSSSLGRWIQKVDSDLNPDHQRGYGWL